MSVRIKISYTDEEELAGVIRLLSPVLISYKAKKGAKGNHKNAYAAVDDGKMMRFIQDGNRTPSEPRENTEYS